MGTVKRFLTTVIRTLIREPALEPKIQIIDKNGVTSIDIDIGHHEIAVLIGKSGSMKFAMQRVIAHFWDMDPDDIRLFYSSTCQVRVEKNHAQSKPDPELMSNLFSAFLEMVPEAKGGAIETSETMVIAKMEMPEKVLLVAGYHMTRIFRAAAASNGFQATLYLSKSR